ncbi:MAG: hypothetical protein A2428_10270 [Bdellovibrionales bacterium RIFOXYC1_FULL_54_43]|nr:MAG: hypothetical protein A2428_10270 [Bdellovibrionales bacterium RIFOXYC1_FULL_54_43]OFZ80498.1 MAG: hypothetical protein A2603_12985 [Bdellovibrionales bacterium RIFOXYD1_FULL_55_31]
MAAWSNAFEVKTAAGFAVAVAVAAIIAITSVYALRLVVRTTDVAIFDYSQEVIQAESTNALAESMIASSRGYLLSGQNAFLKKTQAKRTEFLAMLDKLPVLVRTEEGKRLVKQIAAAAREYLSAVDRVLLERQGTSLPSLSLLNSFEAELQPRREQLSIAIAQFVSHKQELLARARIASKQTSARAILLVVIIAGVAISLTIALAILLTRTLTKLYREAQIALRVREDVLAIVSHDLKNPLAAMLLNIKVLTKLIRDNSGVQEFKRPVALLQASVSRMSRLIADLLDASRLEAGQFPIGSNVHVAAAIVKDALATIEPMAAEKSVQIDADLRDTETQVMCDHERIVQVLSNLIGNALKFTPRGGKVVIRTFPMDNVVRFTVSDTGPGIPEDQLRSIFDRYKQARSQDRTKGSGLGLFIVRGILRAHGTDIDVKSTLGKGSTFEFTLPRVMQIQQSTDGKPCS